jgi:hypothetical protein
MKVFRRRRLPGWVIAGALLLAGQSEAHHSFAVFDGDKTIEIRGVIVDFKLRNPHSSLVVDGLVFIDGVPQGRGAERWEIEADATAPMRTSGIDESTFSVGHPITILANPHKQRGFRFARARSLSAADGKEYLLGFRGSDRIYSPTLQRMLGREPGPVASVTNNRLGVDRIAGRWQQPLSGRSDGSVLPLNVAGAEAREAYDPTGSPANTCEPINMPELLHAPFFLLDIEVAEDRAIFKHELYDIVRTVPLGGQTQTADPEGRFGLITGRVQDNQLIVNSHDYPASKWGLGIATQPLGGGADVPSSDQKTVTERYSVSDDGQTLSVEYTLEDSVYLERPYHGRVELTRVPDTTAMYPYQCDPESAAMWSRSAGAEPLRVGGQ